MNSYKMYFIQKMMIMELLTGDLKSYLEEISET